MKISIKEINKAGLSDHTIEIYQSTQKAKEIIMTCLNSSYEKEVYPVLFPHIIVYSNTIDGKYTIADGIHRYCAYLALGVENIHVDII